MAARESASGSKTWQWVVAVAAATLFLILVVLGLLSGWPFGDDSQAQKFTWLGDPDGGAPYVFERTDGGGYAGFEVELADYLAHQLGLKAKLVRGSWDLLPQDLNRGRALAVFNGYEWSPDREQVMRSTIPYFIFRLQLIVDAKHSPVQGWDDLKKKNPRRPDGKWRVGVLSESVADRYMRRDDFAGTVSVIALSEEGTTGVMNMVRGATPRLDATVQDVPVLSWYRKHGFADLTAVGKSIVPSKHPYYVIFVRKGDKKLQQRLNRAMVTGLRDGTFKSIYEKYDLYNEEDFQQLVRIAEAWEKDQSTWPPDVPDTGMSWDEYGLLLARAAITTVLLACLSMPLAIVIGLIVAVGRLYGPRWVRWPMEAYVEVLRGTPLLMQLFVVFYVLPQIGIDLPPFWAGVVALAINYSSYEAEVYRAGLSAIPRGQMEAALSLGMTKWTALRRVLIPQAIRMVVPPVTNDFIALFKDTSICSVIAVVELTSRFRGLMVNHPQDVFYLCLMTALLYLLMSYPLSLLARQLERRVTRVAGG